jgi:hypothetical protein
MLASVAEPGVPPARLRELRENSQLGGMKKEQSRIGLRL